MRLPRALQPAVAALHDVDAPVVVGVSGGADSVTTLVVALDAGLRPIAVYVDHGLRSTSATDGARVHAIAEQLGVPSLIVRVDVAAGSNLEARARDARYAALEGVRVARGATAVLVGHTADDQAETVLLNLLRGSGPAGIGAMAPRRDRIVRPLLAVRRRDTVELCARLGVTPVSDPMNDDLAFKRVWLRREVIPLLERGADRELTAVLARQAEVFRSESELLDELAGAWQATCSARELSAMPVALARRAVRSWLGAPPPSFDDVDAVLRVARGDVRAVELAGGRRVTRRDGALVCVASAIVDERAACDVAFPGHVRALGVELDAWVERDAPVRWPDGRWTVVVDADAIGGSGRLRRRPSNGQLLLTEPAGRPVWTVGYRVDRRVRVTERTRRYLWITARPEKPEKVDAEWKIATSDAW